MANHKTGGIKSWDDLREAAKHGYSDAIAVLATIEIIERSNRPPLLEAINDAEAGPAALMLRDAAFLRVQLLIVRAFDPVRNGDDIHLRAAINFLREPGRIDEEHWPDRRADLHRAIELFDAAAADPRLSTLKHMRNKEIAHWARYGDDKARPLIRELFGFAKDTCLLWQQLSFGAGTCMIEVDHQIDLYREAAEAFWSRWEPKDGEHED
jgi:hypothetical protein